MQKVIVAVFLLALASPVLANEPSNYLNPVAIPLTAKERKALQLSSQWNGGGDVQPYMAAGGKLMYVHGASLPTVIAAPFQVCDVELEPGETINEIVVGDSARWMVESGTAGNTTHLFIKPVDSGLETSAVITTDRRVYHLRLLSRRSGHTPYVGFTYSDAIRRTTLQKNELAKKEKEWQSTKDEAGRDVDLSKLNFNYEVNGKAAWKPERVFDDGLKTYIRLPDATRSGEMPALLVRKGDKDVLVNYRINDTTMMVDGLFKTIALVAGVGGDQESVEIRRAK
ncbi:P-type conjugative transfer protein TrbG [Desulfocastanea catecholica]